MNAAPTPAPNIPHATPVKPRGRAMKGGASSRTKMDGVTIAIVVIACILGVTLIAVIAVASANYQKSQCVKRYYRGEGVRLASAKRRFNLSPVSWSIGTFNRVLPGSATVLHGETFLLTKEDWRPFIARGDPVKVGPQVFMVSKDLSRTFSDSYVPLDTSTSWIDSTGKQLSTPGKLLGPSREGVTVYTCDSCELPHNQWTGPRGGAIGYWDRAGVWHEGSCTSACPHWYSPVWMGMGCAQQNGPSPGTLAKVQSREFISRAGIPKDERDEDEQAEEMTAPSHRQVVRAALPPTLPSLPSSPIPRAAPAAAPVLPPSSESIHYAPSAMHVPPPHPPSMPRAPPSSSNQGPLIQTSWKGQPVSVPPYAPPQQQPVSPPSLPDMAGFTRF